MSQYQPAIKARRRGMTYRFGWALLGGLLLASSQLQAQGATLEMDRATMVIAGGLYQPGCASQFESVANLSLRPTHLLQKAICMFYSSAPQSSDSDAYRSTLKEIINLLSNVQTSGIDQVGRDYAIFLNGIAACRLARTARAYNLQDPYFCPARAAALELFQAVAWDRFLVIYQGTDGNEDPVPMNQLINEMTSCYADILSTEGNYDASCGVISNADDLEKIADQQTKKVFASMFTDASSPIDAIIQRKKKMTEGVLQRSRDQLWGGGDRPADNGVMPTNSLGGKAFVIQSNYTKLQDAKVELDRRVTDIKDRYGAASRAASLIIEEYQRLSDGMYEDENHKNWKLDISDASNALGDQLRVAQQKTDSAVLSNWDRLKNLPDLINEMFKYAENRKPTIDQLCRIYFCELLQSQHLEIGRGAMTRGCMDTATRGNHLCVKPDAKVADIMLNIDGSTEMVKVADLCKEAGFGVEGSDSAGYLRIGGSGKDRDNCMANR